MLERAVLPALLVMGFEGNIVIVFTRTALVQAPPPPSLERSYRRKRPLVYTPLWTFVFLFFLLQFVRYVVESAAYSDAQNVDRRALFSRTRGLRAKRRVHLFRYLQTASSPEVIMRHRGPSTRSVSPVSFLNVPRYRAGACI